MNESMKRNAAQALTQLLEVRPGEHLLVVTDEATRTVGEAYLATAKDMEIRCALYVLPEATRPLLSVPEDLAALIQDKDVAITAFHARPEETPFRIGLIKALMKSVRRLGHGPGITEAMLREGPMAVDYRAMALDAHQLMRRFRGATRVHMTAPGGTDLTLDITGRDFETDTEILDGQWGNLPAGEIWCAPVENGAHGILVCDGSIGDLGQVPNPVRLTVEAGRVTDIDCRDAPFLKRLMEVLSVDDEARGIGEMGIGLNPGASLVGNLLEDEKAFRTAHIAFGNNDGMPGGCNRSMTHRDFLVREPTLTVYFGEDKMETLIRDGNIVPETSDVPTAIRYGHILVPVDFSDASVQALRVADSLAREHGAILSVCHVMLRQMSVSPLFPQYVAMPDQNALRQEEERVVEHLDDIVRQCTARGPDEYQTIVIYGQPAVEVVRIAEERKADLIVLANRGSTGFARMLLGSVAESIVRHAHCHVLLTR